MTVARIGDFAIGTVTVAADREIAARRTERLIRACDPECYRILVSDARGMRVEQADHRVDLRARDITLHDTSQPCTVTPRSLRGRSLAEVLRECGSSKLAGIVLSVGDGV